MIKQIFILRDAGTCVYHLDFMTLDTSSKSTIDPVLVSGFFAAIMTFAEVTTGDKLAIRHIPMKNLDYYFYKQRAFFFIIETNFTKKGNVESFTTLLSQIATKFFDYLEEKELEEEMFAKMIEDDLLAEFYKEMVSKYIRKRLLGLV